MNYRKLKVRQNNIKRLRQYFEKKELFIRYKFGRVTYRYLKKASYGTLLELSYEISPYDFEKLREYIFCKNKSRIQKEQEIRVYFVEWLDSTWVGDDLYYLFENDNRFRPYILHWAISGERNNERTQSFFENKGYRIVNWADLNQQDEENSIFIYRTVYDQTVVEGNIGRRKMSSLVAFIPYTFWCDKASDSLVDHLNTRCFWKNFCPTSMHVDIGRTNNSYARSSFVFTGYPKMDTLVAKIRKHEENNEDNRTIIYAPGYCSTDHNSNFSTFDENSEHLYKIARLETEIHWILRPHPRLGESLVASKVIKDLNVYAEYIKKWEELPNAEVSLGGDYYDIFLKSDAMITDSISFLSTYQYVKKPLLLLVKNDKLKRNKYGNELMKILYKCNCDDYEGIKSFVNQVVNGEDELFEKRENFVQSYLNYVDINGMKASEYIYRVFKSELK